MALAVGGGREGLRSYEALSAAVNQPQQTFAGNDLYPTIAEKAAAYGFFIAESQAFVEGSKRTAVISMLAFLEINEYEFYQTDQEIEDMFVSLGDENSAVDKDEFTGWVCNHAKEKPGGSC